MTENRQQEMTKHDTNITKTIPGHTPENALAREIPNPTSNPLTRGGGMWGEDVLRFERHPKLILKQLLPVPSSIAAPSQMEAYCRRCCQPIMLTQVTLPPPPPLPPLPGRRHCCSYCSPQPNAEITAAMYFHHLLVWFILP